MAYREYEVIVKGSHYGDDNFIMHSGERTRANEESCVERSRGRDYEYAALRFVNKNLT